MTRSAISSKKKIENPFASKGSTGRTISGNLTEIQVEGRALTKKSSHSRHPATKKDMQTGSTPAVSYPSNPALATVRKTALACRKCPLNQGRKTVVFGTGNENADLIFVGEAPGAEEDARGEPFVGRAGKLLTRLLEEIGLSREEVYIANIIKCRPPGNRNPRPDEIASCEPYLVQQLEIIRPRVICALGSFATQTLLETRESISRLRGRFHLYHNIRLLPMYHPAYILRNPNQITVLRKDMLQLKEEYHKGKEDIS